VRFFVLSFLIVLSAAPKSLGREKTPREGTGIVAQQAFKGFKRVTLIKEGRLMDLKSAEVGAFLRAIEIRFEKRNLHKFFKLKKTKKYSLEIDVLEKNDDQADAKSARDEIGKYVLQISAFDLKSKNKVAETSMDCCN
jgi:hypothetical protein